jgi:acyl carrier protein
VWKYAKTVDLGFEDRLVLFAAPSLFVSVKLSLLGLLNGASLHCLDPGELTPAAFASKVRELGVTVMWLVRKMLRHITKGLGPSEKLDTLRFIHLAGDRVDWGDFDAFRRACSPQACLRTGLGTTECGGITHWIVDDQLRGTCQWLPVGQAFRDLTLTIVDDEGRPVADGDVGELYVSGRYIALGYWQDPELTARTFVTDPADPGWRTYKTGDLALRRPDGLFEYVGRKDRQIKLSGQRIELGEVESALRSCHGVRDAAVVVRRDDNGMPRQLAAYCELESAVTELLPRHLSAMLAEILPLFMMPRSITILDALPRLSNFKINHQELRRRDQLERENIPQVEPGTKTQEILLRLWRDVLKRQDIGCDDDFFLCGGDSLSAVDLLYRIEEELQYQLPLTILADASTVSRLESRLFASAEAPLQREHLPTQHKPAENTRTLGPLNNIRIHAAGSRRPLFAVCGLYGHALRLLPVLRSLEADQPCYALQPPGMDWNSVGCATLPQIAAHYVSEVKAKQPQGPYRLLGTSFGGLVVFEMALQLQRMGESTEYLLMVDTDPPTCLVEGIADVWQLDAILDTRPQPPDSIEALNFRVAETHLRMTRNYTLDSRLDENLFRGELTYFYCAGNPIVGTCR